jgi:hypothetical protein
MSTEKDNIVPTMLVSDDRSGGGPGDWSGTATLQRDPPPSVVSISPLQPAPGTPSPGPSQSGTPRNRSRLQLQAKAGSSGTPPPLSVRTTPRHGLHPNGEATPPAAPSPLPEVKETPKMVVDRLKVRSRRTVAV